MAGWHPLQVVRPNWVAPVIAACSSKEKGAFCRRLGAHHVIEYGGGDDAAKVLKAEHSIA